MKAPSSAAPHLATVAEVALNSAPVGRAANANRPHAWDVTRLLAAGQNLLEVTLFSAPAQALARQAGYPYAVPANQVRAWTGLPLRPGADRRSDGCGPSFFSFPSTPSSQRCTHS